MFGRQGEVNHALRSNERHPQRLPDARDHKRMHSNSTSLFLSRRTAHIARLLTADMRAYPAG